MESTVDLSVLNPSVLTVTINENTDKAEVIRITPLRFKQFSEITKHIVLIRSAMMKGFSSVEDEEKKGLNMLDLLELVAEHSNEVGEIIQIACRKDKGWTDELEITDIAKLTAAVIEVNRDFFFQKLVPVLQELVKRMSNGAK